MNVEEMMPFINEDFFNAPLDKLIHLNDYKMFGEDSYVCHNKELLHGLYECTYLSMNDLDLNGEALEYFIKENRRVGRALAKVHGIEQASALEELATIQEVINRGNTMNAVVRSPVAMNAITGSAAAMNVVMSSNRMLNAITSNDAALKIAINSTAAMAAITNSALIMSKIAKNSGAMNEIANNADAMNIIAGSTTAMIEVAHNSAAVQAVMNSRVALNIIADSATAMSAVTSSPMALNAFANSQAAMGALANSSLRKIIGPKQKVDNGLMLVMGIGYNHYLDIRHAGTGGITFNDGATYPAKGSSHMQETRYSVFGSFFKSFPKAAVHARSYVYGGNYSDSTMDIILIKGNIINY